jgi:(S)-citramalyl-CoA lyase
MIRTQQAGLRRSLLFVPGNRTDRFGKAIASGADIVCLDLEDGVPGSDKQAARTCVLGFLANNRPACEVALRINAVRTQTGVQDLLQLAQSDAYPDLVILPKVESAEEVAWVRSLLGEFRPSPGIVPFVETLAGLSRLESLAMTPGTALLGLGTADLAADMGVTMDWEPLLLARLQLVQAASRARVGAIDGAWLHLDDRAGLLCEVRRSAALGYTAKVCVHPKQVEGVHAAFAPSEEQVLQARNLIAAFEAAGTGVCQFKGRMIDLPVVNSARRQLRLWEAASAH